MSVHHIRTFLVIGTVLLGLSAIAALDMQGIYIPNSNAANASFSCDEHADGNYPNPDDCHSYISCSGGRKDIVPCQPGLIFDETKGISGLGLCVDAKNYKPEKFKCKLKSK